MRLVAYELGRIVGSTNAIYVPASSFCLSGAIDVVNESGTFYQAIDSLQVKCGPPAPPLAAIQNGTNGNRSGDGYFIDDFADLLPTTSN